MEIAKVTSKGQVTVPKAVREKLELEAGSKIVFIQVGDELVIRNADTQASELARRSDEIKQRFFAETAAKYNLDRDQIQKEAQTKSPKQLLEELQQALNGVAEENGWETEQDVADYVNSMRQNRTE